MDGKGTEGMDELDFLRKENAELKRQLEERRLQENDGSQMTVELMRERLTKASSMIDDVYEKQQKRGPLTGDETIFLSLMKLLITYGWSLLDSIESDS